MWLSEGKEAHLLGYTPMSSACSFSNDSHLEVSIAVEQLAHMVCWLSEPITARKSPQSGMETGNSALTMLPHVQGETRPIKSTRQANDSKRPSCISFCDHASLRAYAVFMAKQGALTRVGVMLEKWL